MNRRMPAAFCLGLALSLCACEQFLYVPLRVIAFSPAESVYVPGASPAVWVEFSAAVDRSRAEQAMSLSRDKTLVPGRYSWGGNRLAFTPLAPFETGCEYCLKVDTSVEDAHGNSLEREFLFRFRFGSDATRPTIVDAYPATARPDCDPRDNEALGSLLPDDLYHPITFVFSEAVDQAGFYQAFSLSPDIRGYFTWPDPTTAVFTPAEPYEWQTEYRVSVSTDLRDLEGNNLGDAFVSHFFIGTDLVPPAVASITSVIPVPARQGEAPRALQENTLVTGWEADWEISIRFSEPVTEASVDAAVTLTPGWDFEAVFDPLAPDRVILRAVSPASRLRHGQAYTLRLRAGLEDRQGNKTTRDYQYPFFVDGAFTRPPAVSQVAYLENSAEASPAWTLLNEADTLDINPVTPADGILDFYFTCAERAVIPAAAFAEHFTIEIENYCVTAVKTGIEAILPGMSPSPPLRDPIVTGQTVIRVYVRLTDDANYGTVALRIASGLQDQSLDNRLLHNALASDWSLRLRDPE